MPEQARVEDFEREGQVALTGKGGGSADECFRLSDRLAGREPPLSLPRSGGQAPVRLAASTGALVMEPGDEVITADQIRRDRDGMIPQQGWQIGKVQDVR